MASMKAQLADMQRKLGTQPAGGQQHPKGAGKSTGTHRVGGRRNVDKSEGWHCVHCEFFNFGYRPVCFKCKEAKAPKTDGPGVPGPPAKAVASLEGDLKKHIVVAKDFPALQSQLQTALHAVQQQKQENLPPSKRRAHLLAQAKSLADKMDVQAKVAQEATQKREQFREELVSVYLALEKLPAESLPLPKLSSQPAAAGPGVPAPPPPAMLALLNYTRQKAQDGDQEAQTIYEQIEIAREMEQPDADLDGNGDPSNEDQTAGDDASMPDASAELQEPCQEDDHARGEADVAEGDAEARKRIRQALEQGVDPLGLTGGSNGPSATAVLDNFLVRPKSKAKSQPSTQD
eukprot:4924452-Amphidinium_carterae.1